MRAPDSRAHTVALCQLKNPVPDAIGKKVGLPRDRTRTEEEGCSLTIRQGQTWCGLAEALKTEVTAAVSSCERLGQTGRGFGA